MKIHQFDKLTVQPFYEKDTGSFSYVVFTTDNLREAMIVDAVANFDYPAGKISYEIVRMIEAFCREQKLKVKYIIDTHPHADHITAMNCLKQIFQAPTLIGRNIIKVQETWSKIYNFGNEFKRDGTQFDMLVDENSSLMLGELPIRIIETPGHTPSCTTWNIDNLLFVGDTIFMPDSGTARTDFPGGSASILYDSIQKLYQYPDDYHIFVCHDYCPGDRELKCMTTVIEQKNSNIHVNTNISKEEYIKLREARDKTLSLPRYLYPSIQINIRAGQLNPNESNGVSYVKLPITII